MIAKQVANRLGLLINFMARAQEDPFSILSRFGFQYC